jgi:AbrB family looped-hinge helix DNA binding protein
MSKVASTGPVTLLDIPVRIGILLDSKNIGLSYGGDEMSETQAVYRVRVRGKGQVTLPDALREKMHIAEGDELTVRVTGDRMVMETVQVIPPDQSWFWSERWQQMEREAQADIDAGRVEKYITAEEAIVALKKAGGRSRRHA